jgi:DNA repair ATPase RecN
MTNDISMPLDNVEAHLLLVQSEKNTLEELRAELYAASKDVISSYKRYSHIKGKLANKDSARIRAKLRKAEGELGACIDAYSSVQSKVRASITTLVEVHDNYLSELHLSGDVSAAKKAARAMDSYLKRIEGFVERVHESVACISSHYTLCIRARDDEFESPVAEKNTYDVQKTVPNTNYVHSNEVEIPPVSIDIGPTVERAVERAIAELSATLDRKIAETVSGAEIPVPESKDTAVIVSAAERLATAGEAMSAMITQLNTMVDVLGELTEKCRAISEAQSSVAAELSDIEQRQSAVSEAQEKLLQAQVDVEESIKDAVKVQRSLLKSNSKCIEKLDKQIKKAK